MSGWLSYFTGKKDNGGSASKARTAIIDLREQLLMLDKQEEHMQKKIDMENEKAKANATTNKRAALQALRNKKTFEGQLDRLTGTRMTLETQMNALESANMNLQTMEAMKRGSEALKGIHGKMNIDKVDATMDAVREQMELTNEISDAISHPVGLNGDLDDEELNAELEAMEQEQLNDRLLGADRVPVTLPSSPMASREAARQQEEEDDDDAQLRRLQAEMAM
ncbi:related to snf7 protein [Phaffia rhodozyma]|uniref:Vacuolar-sorting protein SNF7 n=1 Tax=Phaffia rhodozyma TaxID=264483 RepID=A0A0F7SE82_PHARH|nr:related to snf7 protein [Phaffia rhodozyma]